MTYSESERYLNGVLASDRTYRCNKEFNPQEIGASNVPFWRAVIEIAGYIGTGKAKTRWYPRLKLTGSHAFLTAFLDFLAERLPQIDDWTWPEIEEKLRFQASAGELHITGAPVVAICKLLYEGQTIGLDSIRTTVDEILEHAG